MSDCDNVILFCDQERLEKERKEKERLKKKEKIERMKQEGKYMTAKQKEAQRRAQQMLEAMRAQGNDHRLFLLASATEKRRARGVALLQEIWCLTRRAQTRKNNPTDARYFWVDLCADKQQNDAFCVWPVRRNGGSGRRVQGGR